VYTKRDEEGNVTCCAVILEKHNAGAGYDERLRVGWDFAGHPLLEQGATLTGTPAVSVDDVEGCQDGLLLVEPGSATIAGTRVLCWVTGGTPEETYVLRCAVELSDGHKLVESIPLDLFRLSSVPVVSSGRANPTRVAGLLGGNYDGCAALGPYLDAAHALAERVAACAEAAETPLTEAQLGALETWLAAHFYTQMDRLYQSVSTADASATFLGESGKYYRSSPYGETAMALDPSGCLASFQAELEGAENGVGGRQATGFWLGRDCTCHP
jgi:hypothetical protein